MYGSDLFSQNKDEQAILAILDNQTKSWNKGNLEEFMQGYWKHDSLVFVGKNGLTYGFENTMNNYKRNYSDTVQMGKLHFKILKTERLATDIYFVIGKWSLLRSVGNLSGHYSLIFRKINGVWTIISDHSS